MTDVFLDERKKVENFINKNKKKYLTKKISITELLENSLSRYNDFVDLLTRNFNFNKEKVLTSQMFKINDYVFKHVQEASQKKKHNAFVMLSIRIQFFDIFQIFLILK